MARSAPQPPARDPVVTLILASRPNVYSSSPLDRAGVRREDSAWIEHRLADPDTLFVPVWRNRNLVRGMDAGTPEAVFISGETAAQLRMHGGPWAFLGMQGEQAGLRRRYQHRRRPGAAAAGIARQVR